MSAVGRLHASAILWIDELLQKAPATAMHQIEATQPDDLGESARTHAGRRAQVPVPDAVVGSRRQRIAVSGATTPARCSSAGSRRSSGRSCDFGRPARPPRGTDHAPHDLARLGNQPVAHLVGMYCTWRCRRHRRYAGPPPDHRGAHARQKQVGPAARRVAEQALDLRAQKCCPRRFQLPTTTHRQWFLQQAQKALAHFHQHLSVTSVISIGTPWRLITRCCRIRLWVGQTHPAVVPVCKSQPELLACLNV